MAEHREKSLSFLSRDGYIISKAFGLMYPSSEYSYLYVSRRSLTVPLLVDASSFTDVVDMVPYIKRTETMETLLSKLGIGSSELVSRMEERFGKEISRRDLLEGRYDSLFGEIEHALHENARDEARCMHGYLSSAISENAFVVDLGWYGTIQKCLQNALKKSVTGLYLGLLRHEPDYRLEDAHGYVYDYRDEDAYDSSLVFAFNGLIETFFSAPHGSVRRYIENADGSFAPVLEEPEKENEKALDGIHRGALEFVSNYSSANRGHDFGMLSHKYAFSRMESLLMSPSEEEVNLLGSLWFYDASYDRLVCSEPITRYIRSPKRLLYDLQRSNWKAGFFRKLFGSSRIPRLAYKALLKAKGGR